MKKSKEETAKSRQRILKAAANRFRAHGFAGVSVKELMADAGLTHGAFYAHFPSKEALMGAACTEAMQETSLRLLEPADSPPAERLDNFLKQYLSNLHVQLPERGCALAALASEASREPGEVKQAMAAAVKGMQQRIADCLPEEGDRPREERALSIMAEALGTVVLARAVEPGPLQDALLAAARGRLLGR